MANSLSEVRRLEPGRRMSQAVRYGGVMYTAGQVDDSPTVAEQTRAVLAKIDALLAAGGTDKSACLSANVWLADIGTFDEMNAVWDQWVDPRCPPARATVESRLASSKYLVEIAVVAATPLRDARA